VPQNVSCSVATRLRRGGIFSNHFIANFPQNVSVKKGFENRSIFGEDTDRSLQLSFSGRPVFCIIPSNLLSLQRTIQATYMPNFMFD